VLKLFEVRSEPSDNNNFWVDSLFVIGHVIMYLFFHLLVITMANPMPLFCKETSIENLIF
jgi:hypothetical protein